MGDGTAPVAFLLATLLALAGLAVGSHDHAGPAAPGGHAVLPSFEAEHSRPDRALHIEGASSVEAEGCAACLLPHRQRAELLAGRSPAAPDPDDASLVPARIAHRAAGAFRLPAPRGPPPA